MRGIRDTFFVSDISFVAQDREYAAVLESYPRGDHGLMIKIARSGMLTVGESTYKYQSTNKPPIQPPKPIK